MYHCKSTGQRPQVPNTKQRQELLKMGLFHMGRPCWSPPHLRPSATDMREPSPPPRDLAGFLKRVDPCWVLLLVSRETSGSSAENVPNPTGGVLFRPSAHLPVVMFTLPFLTLPVGLTRRKPSPSPYVLRPGQNSRQPPCVGPSPYKPSFKRRMRRLSPSY